ncbi:hypothetical protein THAR02_11402 [Trichoderma harzianum]|uniref:CCHC-type domain-containing protein n=1 Tax=Trichoderma harzianum TaxID=5544 RepID=A0A0F9X6N2_TRIHA|nr:hypothetical protein THAR02_11402 [Trichoderma harzianum]
MPTFNVPENDTDHESQAPSDHHSDSIVEFEDASAEMAHDQQHAPMEALEQEHEQHEQQEQSARARMENMERMIRDLHAQRQTDQQLIVELQQQQQRNNEGLINQHAQTINGLRTELHNSINNPPVVAPPVAPAVAPAVAPTVAPTVAPMVPAPADDGEPELGRTLKVDQPTKFDGDTSKLRKFLDDLRTYFEYYFKKTFPEQNWEKRIRYAGTRMEGAADDWFKSILKDKQNNAYDQQTQLTKDVFESYESFETQLERSFGITNEAQEAEKKLRNLKQKGPCYKHTSTFIQLLSKVNWTEDSKKEMYYYSLKPEVKDEIYKIDLPPSPLSPKKQLKSTTDKGNANQGKKREEYIAKDNGTKPGRMDIDAINHKKFQGTCNACGKKGHKEADCRSKITCGFCSKKGHDEAHCYTKKNKKNAETIKDKAQIDAITEIPHDHLSWTACYDDSCLVHRSSKDGSGYYPRKPRAKKTHKTIAIDTLNFRDGDSDFSADSLCEYCRSSNPHCDCQGKRLAVWKAHYICDDCRSRDPNHTCMGCPDRGSFESPHECEAEWRQNMEAMCELFEEEDRLAKEHLEEQEIAESKGKKKWEPSEEETSKDEIIYDENGKIHEYSFCTTDRQHQQWINTLPDTHPFAKHKKGYECEICGSTDLNHDCEGCRTCGSYDPEHDCMYVLGEQAEEQEKQKELRRYLDENPPQQMTIEEARNYCPQKHASKTIREALDEDCGKPDWMLCDSMYCQKHVFDKLEDRHDQQIEEQLFKKECTKEHFLDCEDLRCTKHAMIKYRFRLLTRTLTKRGYNTITHKHSKEGSKTLIKEFHSMIEERIYDIKCKWCYKYQGKTWRESHLGKITIDSIGTTKTSCCGADRNLITPQMVNLLGLPYAKKKQPTYVSSVATPNAEATINYETDHLPIMIAGHTETIRFDIMPLNTCDVLLGHPWLKQGNPLINWKTKEILWDKDVTQGL